MQDCQKLCKEEPSDHADSSAMFLSPLQTITKLISSIWKIFVFFITDLYLDKRVEGTHQRSKYVMCCEDEMTYFRNFSKTEPLEGSVECDSCRKNITLSPLPDSNVVLVIDNNRDCLCKLTHRTKTSYFNQLCQNPVSQWQSDLSQQICFDKLGDNVTAAEEGTWKCSATDRTYSRDSERP